MAAQEPGARPGVGGPGQAPDHGQPRMRQRIALAALGQQQGAARVAEQVPCVVGEARQQQQRRAVESVATLVRLAKG